MAADEINLGPAEVYIAPVGEAFPAVNATPAGNWVLIGTQGSRNYTEDGVIVRRPVEHERIGALGTTLTRKVGITSAGFEVEFAVMDMNPEELLAAMGGETTDITDTAAGAGTAGHQSFPVPTDPVPVERAMLVRWNRSPFAATGFKSQIEIKVATQVGQMEGTFSKSQPFAPRHQWIALEPDSGDAVVFRQQDAAPA